MKSIESEITIDAPTSSVWSHLVDFIHYPDWNAFIPSISGELREGSKWKVTIHPPGGSKMTFSPKCIKMESGIGFQWKGSLGIPGLFDGEHSFTLTPIEGSKTVLKQNERFTGVLVPLLWKSMYAKTLAGFQLMNQQLKEKVEAKSS